MKLALTGTLAAITLALSAATMAAESDTQETVSGAPDSTVMTQAQNVKAEKKQQKQVKADEEKRGRPADKSSHTGE